MFEVEYKARVDDLERLRGWLQTAGAEALATQRESDVYYAHPMRDFAATDEALRLRTITDETGTRATLTYKGRRAPGPIRTREELEVTYDGALGPVLEALSFRVAGRVVKHRRLYRIGGLVVTLDEVEGLGRFVEVEAIADDDAGVAAARTAVLDLVARLALGPEETRSYLEQVLAKGVPSSVEGSSPPR